MVSLDDFKKIDVRVGTIVSAKRVAGTDKLLRLSVELGEEKPRQIISGIALFFPNTEELLGKQCFFAVNLEPRMIRGYESQGMILAVGGEEGDGAFALLVPDRPVSPGKRVR